MPTAQLVVDDIADTTSYVLVDRTDTTNFPHGTDEQIQVDALRVWADKEGTGDWRVEIMVLEEVDASNGATTPMFSARIATAGAHYFEKKYGNGGQPVAAAHGLISTGRVAANTAFQNDTALASPHTGTTAPGGGDVVATLTEIGGTTVIGATIEVDYHTISQKQ